MKDTPRGNPKQSDQVADRQAMHRRRWITIGTFVVGMLVVGCATVYVWDLTAFKDFESRIAELRAQGEPVSAADIAAARCLPEGAVDCTAAWNEGLRSMEPPLVINMLLPGTEWPELPQAEAHLQQQAPALAAFNRAGDLGGYALLDIRIEDQARKRAMDVLWIERAATLLELDVFVHAHRGNRNEVAKALRTLQSLGRSLESEAITTSCNAMCSADLRAMYATGSFLRFASFTSEELMALQRRWETVDAFASFRRSLRGDRVHGLHRFQDARKKGEELAPILPVLRWKDLATFLDYMQQVAVAADGAPTNGVQQLREDLQSAKSELEQRNAPYTMQVFPEYSSTVDLLVRHEKCRLCLVAGLAAERFRRDNGAWPTKLGDLVPVYLSTAPIDPRDGQPLHLFISEGALLISADDCDAFSPSENILLRPPLAALPSVETED